jgi:hypothetical protein
MMRIGRGSMPARRMASSLVPMPTTCRPNTVRVSTSWATTTSTTASTKAAEMPPIHGAARPEMASPTYCVRESVTR